MRRALMTVFLTCGLAGAPAGHAATVQARVTDPELARQARDLPVGAGLRVAGLAFDGAPASLVLERVQVFAPDARIEIHGDDGVEVRPAPDNAYFRGHVEGHPEARVVLTALAAGGLRGVISGARGAWLLEDGGGDLAARRVPDVPDDTGDVAAFECGSEGLPAPDDAALGALGRWRPAAAAPRAPAVLATHAARVAVETDHEFFLKFGTSVGAVDYVGDLFAHASSVYAREVNTTLLVQLVSLWTTAADPWAQPSPNCGLYEFGRYWNDNRAGVDRTIAHFLSGKSTTAGIAWVGVLCDGPFNVNLGTSCPGLTPTISNYGGGYGYTGGISGSFNLASPGVLWDIVALTHEIGHNFNSPHTHCYGGLGGNANPVDGCYAGQTGAGCFAGTPALPGVGSLTGGVSGQRNGTVMSYCHLLTGGFGNVSMTFGQGHAYGIAAARVPAHMRDHVLAQAAGQPACLAFRPPVKGDFNGDHLTDLVFRNTTTNAAFLWHMNGATRLAEVPLSPAPASADLRLVVSDDFNGDQRTDLVYHNAVTGAVEFWLMKSGGARWGSPVALSGATPLPPDWQLAASADFNADGKSDLLWRNRVTQKMRIWTMNGTAKLGEITPTPDQAVNVNWEVTAALDFNKDGPTDLLWYNPDSGNIVIWTMNASVVRTAGNFTSPANAGNNHWKVVAAGDYGVGTGGAAGTNDIVWRNKDSGKLVIWHMNTAGARTSAVFTTPDAPASPLAVTVVAPR